MTSEKNHGVNLEKNADSYTKVNADLDIVLSSMSTRNINLLLNKSVITLRAKTTTGLLRPFVEEQKPR